MLFYSTLNLYKDKFYKRLKTKVEVVVVKSFIVTYCINEKMKENENERKHKKGAWKPQMTELTIWGKGILIV